MRIAIANQDTHNRLWVAEDPSICLSSAQEVIDSYDSNLIVTPVKIELVGGMRTGDELRRMNAYLSVFNIIDDGKITEKDWLKAEELARRVPARSSVIGKRRQMADCLIRAIGFPLKYEVYSFDKFEREWPV